MVTSIDRTELLRLVNEEGAQVVDVLPDRCPSHRHARLFRGRHRRHPSVDRRLRAVQRWTRRCREARR